MKTQRVRTKGRTKVPSRGRKSERGMTLLITLGFLAILLLLCMSLVITSKSGKKASAISADYTRTRLLCESALDRVIASMQEEFAGDVFPGSKFYRPTGDDPWAGRGYLACINGAATEGVADGLEVKLDGLSFTPNAALNNEAGWTLVKSKQRVEGTETDMVIGRYTYVVIDESGKIDPSAVVDGDNNENAVVERSGASVSEISLVSAGIPNPNAFRPKTVTNGTPGLMPDNGRWFSMSHIVRALQPSQAELQTMVETLHPFSYDTESFWRDADNNGVWDEGEDEERVDLAGEITLTQLYDLFVGADKASAADDCAWLKELDNNAWVTTWAESTGATIVQAKQRIAAQIAANIIDYADEDSVPTPAYVDADGNIQEGNADFEGCYSVLGVERTWGVTEVAMNVHAEVILEDPPHTLEGDLNINPGNSWFEFVMETPSGQINRDDLHASGAGFTYTGAATVIKVKPKAQGRTVLLYGHTITLSPNVQYTISSNDMTVNLRNLNPAAHNWNQAMGHWWIDIRANDVTIDPMPELPEPEAVSLKITPSFKAEVYYPFGVDAFESDPPGELSISYKIQVGTQTGAVGTAEASVVVALDQSAEHDAGTLAWSSVYCAGETTEVAPAFDNEVEPPLNGYFVSIAQITAVTLKDPSDNTVDSLPVAAGGEAYRYLCNWANGDIMTASADYYASLSCSDAMQNGRGEVDSDFLDYWTVVPDANNLAFVDNSDIGNLDAVGYASADFCDAVVKNGSFTRLGELGRVHSYQPMRSLRMWANDSAAEQGHDAGIMDLFKVGDQAQTRGRVNINTLQKPVLEALFSGASTVSASTAAAAVLAKRAAGTTFTNAGQLFGGVSGMSGTDLSQDDVEEAAIEKIAELVTVRPNYFTVLICAQGIKDVAGLRYDSNGDGERDTVAAYNQFDAKVDRNGNVTGYIDKVVAEQKILAVLYRDGFTNQFRVERFEYLTE